MGEAPTKAGAPRLRPVAAGTLLTLPVLVVLERAGVHRLAASAVVLAAVPVILVGLRVAGAGPGKERPPLLWWGPPAVVAFAGVAVIARTSSAPAASVDVVLAGALPVLGVAPWALVVGAESRWSSPRRLALALAALPLAAAVAFVVGGVLVTPLTLLALLLLRVVDLAWPVSRAERLAGRPPRSRPAGVAAVVLAALAVEAVVAALAATAGLARIPLATAVAVVAAFAPARRPTLARLTVATALVAAAAAGDAAVQPALQAAGQETNLRILVGIVLGHLLVLLAAVGPAVGPTAGHQERAGVPRGDSAG